ncbi:MAG TPA: autotransporter domain-containing protein [Sphingomicrobium sp.]|nr:autotransporter domain-containing protein [Sphingomicrobium sp.]
MLGSTANVANAGSITSSTTAPLVEVGEDSSVVNNGTIALGDSTGGAAAVLFGDNGILTNNGALTAISGTPVIQFGQAGTFINNNSATSTVVGNIYFGPNISGGTSTLDNYNTTLGITGNIYSTGNTSIYNDGLITGEFLQTPNGGTVTVTNDSAGILNGSISTGDTTTFLNNGTLSLTTASSIGSARLGVSNFTNNGTLNLGTTTVPTELVINGGFVNGASGVVNIALRSNGASAPVAGTSYSQIYAAGTNGTATLGGTLNLIPSSGFYPTGSTYNVILADQSISGNFATINGNTLPFISFVPVGIVTIGTQQVYEVEAVRSGTYADAIASVATPSELVIAGALQPLVVAADADPTSAAATTIGQIDLLTIPQMQTLLDQINPAGYLAYSQALADQVNLFSRQVMLRTLDPKYADAQTGWWLESAGQFKIGTTPLTGSSEGMWGLTGGFDHSTAHWLAGAALGFSSAKVQNGLESLTGHNQAYMAGAYGQYRVGPFSITAQADYDLGSISTTKALSLAYTTTTTAATSTTAATTTTTATNTDATASSGDHLFKATGVLDFDISVHGLKATPFAGVEYSRGAINGFTESGAGAADLTVSKLNIDRTDVLAGINLTAATGGFRPYIRAAYRSQIGGATDSAVSAYFNGDPTTAFTVDGPGSGRHETDVDAGVNIIDDADKLSVFFGYQGTLRNDVTNFGIHGGVRVQL